MDVGHFLFGWFSLFVQGTRKQMDVGLFCLGGHIFVFLSQGTIKRRDVGRFVFWGGGSP